MPTWLYSTSSTCNRHHVDLYWCHHWLLSPRNLRKSSRTVKSRWSASSRMDCGFGLWVSVEGGMSGEGRGMMRTRFINSLVNLWCEMLHTPKSQWPSPSSSQTHRWVFSIPLTCHGISSELNFQTITESTSLTEQLLMCQLIAHMSRRRLVGGWMGDETRGRGDTGRWERKHLNWLCLFITVAMPLQP